MIKRFAIIICISLMCLGLSQCESKPKKEKPKPFVPKVVLVYSPRYEVNLGGLERLAPFDIHKYEKIHAQLIHDKLMVADDFYAPHRATDKELLSVHTPQFMKDLKNPKEISKAFFVFNGIVEKWSAEDIDKKLLTPFRYQTGGSILAAREALKNGIAINIGGGYHHAEPSKGTALCIFADMPIAIKILQAEKKVKKVLVIDLDVHQGNGTAICLAGDKSTFTFSMHERDIFPIPKAKSDLDVELESGISDDAFMKILTKHLDGLFITFKPDLVFYQAGCDTLAGDKMANLKMTEKGIAKRDLMVVKACMKRKVPIVMTLGGGFTSNAWKAQYLSIRKIINQYQIKKKPRRKPKNTLQ